MFCIKKLDTNRGPIIHYELCFTLLDLKEKLSPTIQNRREKGVFSETLTHQVLLPFNDSSSTPKQDPESLTHMVLIR